MTTPSASHHASDAPITYEFRLAGHLDDRWADWFDGHSLARGEDASTTLTVEVTDQAQLHGLLARLRDLGVTLLSLNPVAAGSAPAASNQPARASISSRGE